MSVPAIAHGEATGGRCLSSPATDWGLALGYRQSRVRLIGGRLAADIDEGASKSAALPQSEFGPQKALT